MTKPRKLLLIAFVLVSCIGCDQVTKVAARTHLSHSSTCSYLGDVFRLQYSENPGALLNLGAMLPPTARFWIFTLLIGAVLAGILIYLLSRDNLGWPDVIALSLILAGGIGNLIDRTFFNGLVTDFMNIGVGGLRTGIFNVADVAITSGAGILLYLGFRKRRTPNAPFH
jgi:signal peptidase II